MPDDLLTLLRGPELRSGSAHDRRTKLRESISEARKNLDALRRVAELPDVQESEAVAPLRDFADELDNALRELRAVADRFAQVVAMSTGELAHQLGMDAYELGAWILNAAREPDPLPLNLFDIIGSHEPGFRAQLCSCDTIFTGWLEYAQHLADVLTTARTEMEN